MVFRSVDMTLCQLYLQAEAAYASVSELGELGIVQFRELNPDVNAFQRNFVSQVRRCEEMERQLRYFERELNEAGREATDDIGSNPEAPAPGDMVDLEATYERLESELKELTGNIEALRRNQHELVELKHVLQQTENFFSEASADMELRQVQEHQPGERRLPVHLGYVAGVISTEKLQSFLRLLWFACRGNVYVRYSEIEDLIFDAHAGEDIKKSVFMVFFQGDQLKNKVQKICEGYRAHTFPCPQSADERREMGIGVMNRLVDLEVVLAKSLEQKNRVLDTVAQNFHKWFVKVLKIKAIYHTMNMFHTEGKNYVAECWMPVAEMGTVQLVLNRATESLSMGATAPSLLHPIESTELPTYFPSNKFTKAFQTIIDAYGVATYKEINPMPFSIITFPFLFSVMFGDTGHGVIMAIFGLWMIFREKKLAPKAENSEIYAIFLGGRYMIAMMGIFSIYSGLIYNDIYSKSMNFFNSRWKVVYDESTLKSNAHLQLDPSDPQVYDGNPYPFGLDPIWQVASNKITFTNSYKEKISVIFAVCQMLTGVILSLFNHTYFRQPLNIFCEFIPQVLFLLSLFGYLDALIIAKWVTVDIQDSACAPDLLIGFINMFLMNTPKKDDEDAECHVKPFFDAQYYLQPVLLAVALVSALTMLLAKPIYLQCKHKYKMKARAQQKELLRQQQGVLPVLSFDGLDLDPEGRLAQESSTDTGPAQVHLLESDTAGTDTHQFESDTEAILPEVSGNVHAGSSNGKRKDKKVKDIDVETAGESSAGATLDDLEEEEKIDFSEVYIIQAIHTIEFCLGCVSHTASYLRLWALSLAHSQLSEVLWNMVMRPGLKMPFPLGAFMTFNVFIMWAFSTIGILLFMEGLSAFLHTLRLHWVEFQSKFYKGEGFSFLPFSFEVILKNVDK